MIMKPRKLEYFEDQLMTSTGGRQVLNVLKEHADEVMYLVQNNRPTIVCWQRNHGPAFIKSFVDSGFEEGGKFKKEIKGVTLEELMLQMAETIQDNGSPKLKATVGKHAFQIIGIERKCNSLKEVISYINQTESYG